MLYWRRRHVSLALTLRASLCPLSSPTPSPFRLAHTQAYSTDGMVSGILTSRYQHGGSMEHVATAMGMQAGAYAYGGEFPPLPPEMYVRASPPPMPPPGASELTKNVMSIFSLATGGLMVASFAMCAHTAAAHPPHPKPTTPNPKP